jgi:hypothetical protein
MVGFPELQTEYFIAVDEMIHRGTVSSRSTSGTR